MTKNQFLSPREGVKVGSMKEKFIVNEKIRKGELCPTVQCELKLAIQFPQKIK